MKKLIFVALALMLTSVSTLNAQVRMTGNPRCADLSPAFNRGFKIEPPQSGINVVTGIGTITTTITNGNTLDWANTPNFVGAVIVKGGTDSNVYYYNHLIAGGTGLTSPLNNGGNLPDISHIEYCYNVTPTAGEVSLFGRVVDANGRGVFNARVRGIDAEGDAFHALTNSFGHFKLYGLDSGGGIVLTFSAKGYTPTSQYVLLFDNITDFNIGLNRL